MTICIRGLSCHGVGVLSSVPPAILPPWMAGRPDLTFWHGHGTRE